MRAAAREPADRELRDRAARQPADASRRPQAADRRRRLPRLERRPRRRARPRPRSAPTPAASGTPRPELPAGTAAVVLPGGFSYGDYLRCGAIARFSPIMQAVGELRRRRRARARHLQRLPDPHRGRAAPGHAPPERVARVRLPRRRASASRGRTRRSRRAATPRQPLTIPVKHGDGCWFADPETSRSSTRPDSSCSATTPGENPNGSVADVAGVCNESGNVFGLMPHPEHAVDALLGSTDGALILGSLVDAASAVSSGALV